MPPRTMDQSSADKPVKSTVMLGGGLSDVYFRVTGNNRSFTNANAAVGLKTKS